MINSIIDHTSISVKDLEQSKKFYDHTLAALGYECLMVHGPVVGYGVNDKPSFWISTKGNPEEVIGNARGVHIAFRAHSVEAVKEWYKRCLEYGGTDHGEPGPRSKYHSGYYGAFIIDPNGWRIEACFHEYVK
jgi:catechol 2,3-dioxygenase-like lactoylglutathione lyase family enzyme